MVESRFLISRFKLDQNVDHKRGINLRKVAKKVSCSHKTISNILKLMIILICCFKLTKIPKRTPLQKPRNVLQTPPSYFCTEQSVLLYVGQFSIVWKRHLLLK